MAATRQAGLGRRVRRSVLLAAATAASLALGGVVGVASRADPTGGPVADEVVATPAPVVPVHPVFAQEVPARQTPQLLAADARRAAALESRLKVVFRRAAAMMSVDCDLDPAVLAGMLQAASGSLVGHQVDRYGRVTPAIVAGDDEAVGPFRFPVSVWTAVRLDGDGDGIRDAQDLDDAAVSAAYLLCSSGRSQGRTPDLRAGLLAVWPSASYVRSVLTWRRVFERRWDRDRRSDLLAATYPVPRTVSRSFPSSPAVTPRASGR